MKLTLGNTNLGCHPGAYSVAALEDAAGGKREWPLSELLRPGGGELARHLGDVHELVLGFVGETDRLDLGFFQYLPNVAKVWVVSDQFKDLSPLGQLARLSDLAIDRPTSRMDFLGRLTSLRVLYLDGWRPGGGEFVWALWPRQAGGAAVRAPRPVRAVRVALAARAVA